TGLVHGRRRRDHAGRRARVGGSKVWHEGVNMGSAVGRLTGKSALVTGAGSGIGAATAELFAREGAKVVVADIDKSSASVTVDRIREEGGVAEAFAADVSDETQVAGLVEFAVESFGGLDVLQNYASNRSVVAEDVVVADADLAVWTQQLSVDLLGCVL